jgi:hypothetical protein
MSDYRIIDETGRVSAVTADDIEICGAYQPAGRSYWSLYIPTLITGQTGLQTPPHREHFWGETGKWAARAWVELIAALYTQAVSGGVAAA